jgi:hypothetical protein
MITNPYGLIRTRFSFRSNRFRPFLPFHQTFAGCSGGLLLMYRSLHCESRRIFRDDSCPKGPVHLLLLIKVLSGSSLAGFPFEYSIFRLSVCLTGSLGRQAGQSVQLLFHFTETHLFIVPTDSDWICSLFRRTGLTVLLIIFRNRSGYTPKGISFSVPAPKSRSMIFCCLAGFCYGPAFAGILISDLFLTDIPCSTHFPVKTCRNVFPKDHTGSVLCPEGPCRFVLLNNRNFHNNTPKDIF